MRLLAAREHSRVELRRKLLARRFADADIEQVLDDLAERGLQSDERFVEQYVAMRRNRGYGPLRIEAELGERGLAGALVDAWIDSRDPEWHETLVAVARRKFGAGPPADPAAMAKRVRFLQYRGFPLGQIRRLLLDE